MKRMIIILAVLLVSLCGTTQAQEDWPGVFPMELFGEKFSYDFWGPAFYADPDLICYHPWGMIGDDGVCNSRPGNIGWPGHIDIDPDSVLVFLESMTTPFGRVLSPPPPAYANGMLFGWDEDCGCYLITEDFLPGLVRFEAWVFNDGGDCFWASGCLKNTGSFGPWWELSTQCIYQEFSVGPLPVLKTRDGAIRR